MALPDLEPRVIEYEQEADEPLLELMEPLVVKYHRKVSFDSPLSEQRWNLIDQRRAAYLRGEEKSYSWEEVKDRARKRPGI